MKTVTRVTKICLVLGRGMLKFNKASDCLLWVIDSQLGGVMFFNYVLCRFKKETLAIEINKLCPRINVQFIDEQYIVDII